MQGFGADISGKDLLVNLNGGGNVIEKLMLNKYAVRYVEWVNLSGQGEGRSLVKAVMNFGFHKILRTILTS